MHHVEHSGHRCEDQLGRLDPLLDDPVYIARLFEQHAIFKDGERVRRPRNPLFT